MLRGTVVRGWDDDARAKQLGVNSLTHDLFALTKAADVGGVGPIGEPHSLGETSGPKLAHLGDGERVTEILNSMTPEQILFAARLAGNFGQARKDSLRVRELCEGAYQRRTGETVDASRMPFMCPDKTPMDPDLLKPGFKVNREALAAASELAHFAVSKFSLLERLSRFASNNSGVQISNGIPVCSCVYLEEFRVPDCSPFPASTRRKVLDFSPEIRQKVPEIAEKHGVHFAVSLRTFGTHDMWFDEFPPRCESYVAGGPLGSMGYCGGMKIYFGKDLSHF